LNQEQIDTSLSAQQTLSTEIAVAEAYRKVLSHNITSATDVCLEDLVERLTGTVPASDSVSPVEVATLATSPEIVVDETELKDVVRDQKQDYENEFDTVRSLLIPSTESTIEYVETDTPIRFEDPPGISTTPQTNGKPHSNSSRLSQRIQISRGSIFVTSQSDGRA